MQVRKPDYYHNFVCIAGDCPATCCAGWEIAIDAEAQKKYDSIEGPLADRMYNSVNHKRGSFAQYEGKCTFLNEEHLCDLYLEAGEDYLCHTCRTYPRHTECYGEERELSLGLSCPEAARIILNQQDKVRWVENEKQVKTGQKKSSEDEFEQDFYEKLKKSRDVIMNVLQMREMSIQERMGTALAITHNIQRRIRVNDLDAVDDLIKKYENKHVILRVAEKVRGYRCREVERRKIMRKMIHIVTKLTVLNPKWSNEIKNIIRIEKKLSDEAYIDSFRQFQAEVMPEYDLMLEQLICYFVMVYYCTAVYDGELYAKMKFSVFAVLIIQEVCFAQWLKHGEKLTADHVIESAFRYAREVEHMNENLDYLDKVFEKKRELCLEEFLISVI